jgi:hypothetical protein
MFGEKQMNYSPELEAALEAMRKITDTSDMHVLAQQYNSHITFLGKRKGAGIIKGDKIAWEYGGLQKVGVVIKVNRKTIEVQNYGNTPFGSTRTRLDKSMILGKVDESTETFA